MLLAFAPLLACVGSHDVGDDTSSSRDASMPRASSPALEKPRIALCERWAMLRCDGEARCCSDAGRDHDACVQALQASCEEQLHLDEVASNPVSGYDADAAERKLEHLEQLVASCDPSVARWELSVDGLRGMFAGTLAQGQSCKPGDVLTADRATLAAAVVACSDVEQVACLPATLLGVWTCAPKQPEGAGCLTDENCASGDFCDNPESSPLGTCAATLPLMAACSGASRCASSACVGGVCVELDAASAYCP
jgi:hypothetical protein